MYCIHTCACLQPHILHMHTYPAPTYTQHVQHICTTCIIPHTHTSHPHKPHTTPNKALLPENFPPTQPALYLGNCTSHYILSLLPVGILSHSPGTCIPLQEVVNAVKSPSSACIAARQHLNTSPSLSGGSDEASGVPLCRICGLSVLSD